MKCVTAFLVMTCGLAALVGNGCAGNEDAAKREAKEDRPFFAVWNTHSAAETGLGTGAYRGPYLRFAYWNDGRVVFAKESEREDKPLRRGRITADRVDRLKQALLDSGIFALKGNCYLVPDGGRITMTVEVGAHQQTLYWDEVAAANYGININPQPRHREFMRCWEALNALGLAARPETSEVITSETIADKIRPQPSWSFKPPIQSE